MVAQKIRSDTLDLWSLILRDQSRSDDCCEGFRFRAVLFNMRCFGPLLAAAPTAVLNRSQPSGRNSIPKSVFLDDLARSFRERASRMGSFPAGARRRAFLGFRLAALFRRFSGPLAAPFSCDRFASTALVAANGPPYPTP